MCHDRLSYAAVTNHPPKSQWHITKFTSYSKSDLFIGVSQALTLMEKPQYQVLFVAVPEGK